MQLVTFLPWPLSHQFSHVFFPAHFFLSYLAPLSFPIHLSLSSPSLSSHLAQNPFICDCNLKWLADYLRSNPIETSGARCASPRRLANKRIGQIKSKKFRCSGRPPARSHRLQMSPSYFSLGLSLSLSLSLRQAVLFLLHLSLCCCSAPTFSLSLRWEWLLSLHLLPIPHTTFNE